MTADFILSNYTNGNLDAKAKQLTLETSSCIAPPMVHGTRIARRK